MKIVFYQETNDFVIIYIDDILILSKTMEDYVRHMKILL